MTFEYIGWDRELKCQQYAFLAIHDYLIILVGNSDGHIYRFNFTEVRRLTKLEKALK